jgi:two-component system phosphate regulon sensor histidine kinase PhoR
MLKNTSKNLFLKLLSHRQLLLRLAFCWGVGLVFLYHDFNTPMDLRFRIRGPYKAPQNIVVVLAEKAPSQGLWKELTTNTNVPIAVLSKTAPPYDLKRVFHFDPESSQLFTPDGDGVVRRYSKQNFAPLIKEFQNRADLSLPNEKNPIINYLGPRDSAKLMSLEQWRLDDNEVLSTRLVILTDSSGLKRLLTPLGSMSKAEIVANISDNLFNGSWVKRLNPFLYSLILLLLCIFCVLIIFYHPQSIAMVFVLYITASVAVLSAWLFDSYFIWFPMLSSLVALATTVFVFLTYKLTLNEKSHWILKREKASIEELEEMKSNFISLFSHDLKTPIAKIQAILDQQLRKDKDEESQQNLKKLQVVSEELHRYIQSILQVTRIEAQTFSLKKDAIDINELISQAVDSIGVLAKTNGVEVNTELEPMFSVEADANTIQEVIINLLENAIKYSPQGKSIRIVSKEVDNLIKVYVEDTGTGIAEDEKEKIWQKFYRGKAHELATKGTGIGLYLVKYFVELHGGSVFLEDNEPCGSRIGFTIPV